MLSWTDADTRISRFGTRMSGREPVSYIFVEPGKGWMVIDDDGVRFSGARSGRDESAGARDLVCGGVMNTLSRRWLKEEGECEEE